MRHPVVVLALILHFRKRFYTLIRDRDLTTMDWKKAPKLLKGKSFAIRFMGNFEHFGYFEARFLPEIRKKLTKI